MRAKLTILIPRVLAQAAAPAEIADSSNGVTGKKAVGGSGFQDILWVLSEIRGRGWETNENELLSDNEKLAAYKQQAVALFQQMPEVAQEEKDHVIFVGFVQSAQTKFVVTKSNQGEATFRLLNENLDKLAKAAVTVVTKLTTVERKARDPLTRFHIQGNQIEIYEVRSDHVIITGRVVAHAMTETFRTNAKDGMTLAFTLFLLLVFGSILMFSGSSNSTVLYTLSLASLPALFLTFVVSLIGLAITYVDIKASTIIRWKVRISSD